MRDLLLLACGLFLVLVTAWWWIIYSQVVQAGNMALSDVTVCIISKSDLCSLAQSLCKGTHLFGIKRYFAEFFWAAGGIAIVLLIDRSLTPTRAL